MALKILVTGDLHIGKRSSSIPADDFRASTRSTWDEIIEYALQHQIDLILLTGDIIDQDNKFYEAVGPLRAGFDKLSEGGIRVFMVAGNHDYDVLPQIVSVNNAENVRLLGSNGQWESALFSKDGETIRIIGWSFPGRYIDNDSTQYIEKDMQNDKYPTFAIVHGDVYAPTSRYHPLHIEKLKNIAGIDAWLLGHIHKPDVLNNTAPLILYPGSPHALSAKEQDIHGPYLLTVDGFDIDYMQIPLSPVCYRSVSIDVSEVTDEDSFRSTAIASLRENASLIQERYIPHYLVFDIEFTGKHNNLSELRKWSDELRNYNFDDKCNIVTRAVEYDLRPQLEIEHLLGDPSYTGVLAAAVQTLETGGTSEFVDKLVREWMIRFRHTVSLPVYGSLHININEIELEGMARDYILRECLEIIGELNIQRNEN